MVVVAAGPLKLPQLFTTVNVTINEETVKVMTINAMELSQVHKGLMRLSFVE